MIILNKDVFSPSYVPNTLLNREKEIEDIKHAIRAFLRGITTHVYCYGLQGTGKTAVAKFLVRELRKSGIKAIYVDAKENSTNVSLLFHISKAYGNFIIPTRGISIDEFLARLKGRADKVIIFLDEADSFKDKDFLYKLAKSEDFEIMFIFISNVPLITFLSKLSSFTITVEFKRYSPKELKDILYERAKKGLKPGSYDEDVIGKIAGFAAKHKANARAAIMLLFHSALIAEEEGKNKIEIEDVEKAKEMLLNSLIAHDISLIKGEKKKILEILLNSQYAELEEIAKKLGKNTRTVKNYLDELIRENYVEMETIQVGKDVKRVYKIKLKV